jgi:hypothetical protein
MQGAFDIAESITAAIKQREDEETAAEMAKYAGEFIFSIFHSFA